MKYKFLKGTYRSKNLEIKIAFLLLRLLNRDMGGGSLAPPPFLANFSTYNKDSDNSTVAQLFIGLGPYPIY